MRRWVLLRTPWLQVVVHQILKADPPGLHDHPWWNVSVVLRGKLYENRADDARILTPGCVVFRRATDGHKLTPLGGPVWTLFITGRARRLWGYRRTNPDRWVPWPLEAADRAQHSGGAIKHGEPWRSR